MKRVSADLAFPRIIAFQVNSLVAASAEFSISGKDYRVATNFTDAASNLHVF
jgi:hypothetical protein